ncbi:heterokaryon incompatibility protein-domain-containing protein, partial [Hygrophoropsis aurantiaca]
MRLLNVATKMLEVHSRPPSYAILSHRWRDGEIQFQDVHQPHAVKMAGYAKLERCCVQAIKDGYRFVWIDTCCIDKSSSAELSEAINSMYSWYQNAEVCYAYLDDVPSSENPDIPKSAFSQSVWFTRGWTLQELIAPESVIFFAMDWKEIGSKASLASTISRITHVEPGVLLSRLTGEVSVLRRMSWAAQRQTTREEDRAYSLMGLFGVNMPTIYGEGNNALVRLQLEIVRTSNDQSIFAW